MLRLPLCAAPARAPRAESWRTASTPPGMRARADGRADRSAAGALRACAGTWPPGRSARSWPGRGGGGWPSPHQVLFARPDLRALAAAPPRGGRGALTSSFPPRGLRVVSKKGALTGEEQRGARPRGPASGRPKEEPTCSHCTCAKLRPRPRRPRCCRAEARGRAGAPGVAFLHSLGPSGFFQKLSVLRSGGGGCGAAQWRGYYHRTGEAPARLSFSQHWVDALVSIPQSRVLNSIRNVLLMNVGFTAVVTWAYTRSVLVFELQPLVHSLLSVPLGLLLVLRTTHAYDRFWQARCAFQRLMDTCREATRRVVTWVECDTPEGELAAERLCGMLLAVVAATAAESACRSDLELRGSLEAFVEEELLDAVEAELGTARTASLVAARAAGRTAEEYRRRGMLTESQQLVLDGSIAEMNQAAGECECIGRTPHPIEYDCHCTRFLVIFCFTLPFVLSPMYGWHSVVQVALVSYSLMGIDEIASVVEAPFQGYLPVRALWAGLRADVAAMLSTVCELDEDKVYREGGDSQPSGDTLDWF